jgi:hypothetical protein
MAREALAGPLPVRIHPAVGEHEQVVGQSAEIDAA